MARGLFVEAGTDFKGRDALVEACKMLPDGVLCLLTALAYHEMTTQLARSVWIAVPRGRAAPMRKHLPLHIVRFSGAALTEGVEVREVNGATIRVYNPAKTVADCFKYRNTIGLDVALEALRDYWHKRLGTLEELEHYAAICRVAKVIRPYIESLVV